MEHTLSIYVRVPSGEVVAFRIERCSSCCWSACHRRQRERYLAVGLWYTWLLRFYLLLKIQSK
jgi:hypothetical protein